MEVIYDETVVTGATDCLKTGILDGGHINSVIYVATCLSNALANASSSEFLPGRATTVSCGLNGVHAHPGILLNAGCGRLRLVPSYRWCLMRVA